MIAVVAIGLKNLSSPFGLRGPVAADLHRPRSAPPLETSPPRHPFAQFVTHHIVFRFSGSHYSRRGGWGVAEGRCAKTPIKPGVLPGAVPQGRGLVV